MQFLPLGDQAVLAYCTDETEAARFADQVRKAKFAWVIDVVQAYVSVAVYYDLGLIDFFEAKCVIERMEKPKPTEMPVHRFFTIPCCYELGLDWPRLEKHLGLSSEAIIGLHTQTIFTVYAIGFCPGFPYMGYLPVSIAGAPRLATPRLRVEAGSVGITGKQTGIYTEERPGGWNIVGRTPLELVNLRDGYFPLRTGDRVQFMRIDEKTFQRRFGERL